jgi:hypothetical protein
LPVAARRRSIGSLRCRRLDIEITETLRERVAGCSDTADMIEMLAVKAYPCDARAFLSISDEVRSTLSWNILSS